MVDVSLVPVVHGSEVVVVGPAVVVPGGWSPLVVVGVDVVVPGGSPLVIVEVIVAGPEVASPVLAVSVVVAGNGSRQPATSDDDMTHTTCRFEQIKIAGRSQRWGELIRGIAIR